MKITKKKSLTTEFLRNYLTIKNGKIPALKNVYQTFKTFYSNSKDNKEEILKEILDYSGYFEKLINPQTEQNKCICQQLKDLKQLDVSVSHPFLLDIYRDFKHQIIDEKIFSEILNLIQSFVIRRSIVDLKSNALNKIFERLYKEMKELQEKHNATYISSFKIVLLRKGRSERMPNDQEVKDALKRKEVYKMGQNSQRYLLEKLENYNNTERVTIEGNPDITIEHIFPQKPSESWHRIGADYEEIKNNYLHTLANLTLSGNNGKLGNKSFLEKKVLKDCGYNDSRLWLNQYLKTINTWNLETLNQRFEILAARFLEIWPYPIQSSKEENIYTPPSAYTPTRTPSQPSYKEGVTAEIATILKEDDIAYHEHNPQEVNIFDAPSPTFKKVDYIRFCGKKVILNGPMINFYATVIREIVKLHLESFSNIDVVDKDIIKALKLRKDKSSLRKPKLIHVGLDYFIETHMSNEEKFKRIKWLLERLNHQNDLFIKYQ